MTAIPDALDGLDTSALTRGLRAVLTDEVQNLSPEGRAAVEAAAAGTYVFPVRQLAGDPIAGKGEPGYAEYRAAKAPVTRLVPHGKDDATTDLFQVVSWWTAEPRARIGVNLERTGWVVSDLDNYKPEDQQRQDLPPLPTGLGRTRRSLSPSGGRHDYYLAPGGTLDGTKRFRDGEFIVNGYTVLPSPGSGYHWEDETVPVAGLPASAVANLFTVKPETIGNGAAPDDEVLAQRYHELCWWLESAGLEYRIRRPEGNAGGRIVAEISECPFDRSDHSVPFKAVVGRGSGGGWFAKCVMDGCGGMTGPSRWAEIRDLAPLPTFHDVHAALGWELTGEWFGDWVSKRAFGMEEDGEILVLAESPEVLAAELAPLRQSEAMRGWVRGTDIEASNVEWLWDGRLPKGKLVLLAGDPGDGKSFISLGIAAAVTRGTGLPNQETAEPGTVLILAQEDGHSDTVKPRLERMDADPERYFVRSVEEPITVNDAALVEASLEFLRDAGNPVSLLVIDPWMGFLTGGVNTWKDNELRAAVQPWIDMAGRHGVTILALVHLNKGDSKPLYRIMGSVASPALARAALLTGKTPDGKMALAVAKSNLARKAATLEYEIVDLDGPDTQSGAVRWGRERTDVKDEDLGASSPARGGQRRDSAVAEAEAFLLRRLANGEWHEMKRVVEVAGQDGISAASLKRARRNLLIETEQPQIPGPWFWRLDPDWEAVG